ncbi:MAG: hypothetical protein HKN23_20525 [Verrucomicrobiales bacterium]|nr:hypothetical protein [Verrucomicrobiales bacterium]
MNERIVIQPPLPVNFDRWPRRMQERYLRYALAAPTGKHEATGIVR